MPPETRRALRAAAEQQRAASAPATKKKRKVGRTIWLIAALLLILLLAVACWVGFKAITVKNEVEETQRLIAALETEGNDAKATVREIAPHAQAAADAAADPVWKALEFLPWAGDNLRAVRLSAESLDVLVNDVAIPVLDASENGEPLLQKLLSVSAGEANRVESLAEEVKQVSSSSALIGMVKSGVAQVDEVLSLAAPALQLAPKLLGAEGPRNYLLVFQNNAEPLALGGSAASQALIHVENGNLVMANQADSSLYHEYEAVDVAVDQSARDLFTDFLLHHVNTSVSRPDFPTAAQILRAWWQRDIAADEIQSVISIDPLALARVLKATGPIQLPTGDTLSNENAVSLLLKDSYARMTSKQSDAFFAAAAQAVFEKVAAGQFDIKDMLWAINESAKKGSILVWSEDPEVTELIAGQRVSGILPVDNTTTTTAGVYFHDGSASKIGSYMSGAITADAVCTADAARFTVTTSLTLGVSQDVVDSLPDYVAKGFYDREKFRDWIYVYGPPGTTVESVSVNGQEVNVMRTDIVDLGRPTAWFEMYLKPEETASVTATFVAAPQEFGPFEVQTNPMVQATQITITDGCGK